MLIIVPHNQTSSGKRTFFVLSQTSPGIVDETLGVGEVDSVPSFFFR